MELKGANAMALSAKVTSEAWLPTRSERPSESGGGWRKAAAHTSSPHKIADPGIPIFHASQ
jgi:hypothetical protein